MLFNWYRKRKDNKLAAQLEEDRQMRQILLNSIRKSVDEKMLHAELVDRPGVRRRPARPTTVSVEHFELLERLGASTEYLKRLRPIVRD